MRAILLAAGRGRRLEPMGWVHPKCLLPIGDTTILDNMLDALQRHGVTDLVMVVGYEQERVRRHVAARGLRPAWVENPDYETTNTINSLWRAREFMDGDFLYFNADVLFHHEVVGRLLAAPGSGMAIDRKRCAEEEVKVVLDEDGRVRRTGKSLDPAACAGEFIGIARFDRAVNGAFVHSLRRHNEELGNVRSFFEAALDDILDSQRIQAVDVSDLPSIEIDFPADYETAVRSVLPRLRDGDGAGAGSGAAGAKGGRQASC